MRIRRRSAVIFALAAAGALAIAAVAFAAPTSTFSFKMSPSNVPKTTYQNGSLFTDIATHYTNPGNNNPGGATERTQIYLDKNWKINTSAATKCSSSQLAGKTMAQAMAACKNALVGTGTATATANGLFEIHGCVLLFNGQPQSGNPTLQVFTRVQGVEPQQHHLREPVDQQPGQRDGAPHRCSEARHGALRQGAGRRPHHPGGVVPPRGVQDHGQAWELHQRQVSDEPLAHEDDLDLQQQHDEDDQQDAAVHLITA